MKDMSFCLMKFLCNFESAIKKTWLFSSQVLAIATTYHNRIKHYINVYLLLIFWYDYISDQKMKFYVLLLKWEMIFSLICQGLFSIILWRKFLVNISSIHCCVYEEFFYWLTVIISHMILSIFIFRN